MKIFTISIAIDENFENATCAIDQALEDKIKEKNLNLSFGDNNVLVVVTSKPQTEIQNESNIQTIKLFKN